MAPSSAGQRVAKRYIFQPVISRILRTIYAASQDAVVSGGRPHSHVAIGQRRDRRRLARSRAMVLGRLGSRPHRPGFEARHTPATPWRGLQTSSPRLRGRRLEPGRVYRGQSPTTLVLVRARPIARTVTNHSKRFGRYSEPVAMRNWPKYPIRPAAVRPTTISAEDRALALPGRELDAVASVAG